MKVRRAKASSFLCAVLSLLILHTSAGECPAADKIRIAVANLNVSFLPAGVALKKGFFKEEGLEAEVISMRPPVSITALSSGDIDYTMVFGSVVRAAMRGLPVKVVASFIDGSTHALLARPEYKSAKELRGKVLGVGSYGATDDLVARMMLKHFGVDPEKEVKVVALGADRARFAALKEGIVDAAVIAPPADSEGKKLGFHILARAYEIFNFPFVGLGTSVRKIKERPEEVRRVLKALIKANRFIKENRDGAVQILAEWGRTEPSYAAASYDSAWKVFNLDGSIPEDGLRLVIEQAKAEAKLTRNVPLTDVSDMAILREAQRELGIKGR
jgi:NitT/TauT family transport system substrate-binding protein